MNKKEFENYKKALDYKIASFSWLLGRMGMQKVDFCFSPKTDGPFYLVIDNTRLPESGYFRKRKLWFWVNIYEKKAMTARINTALYDGNRNYPYHFSH